MGKTSIYFKHGCMNSGKSLELIKVAYNYKENNIHPLILKPDIDTRLDGKVFSRTNLSIDAVDIKIDDTQKVVDAIKANIGNSKIILIDESNFLKKDVVDAIVNYAYDNLLEAVMFFGLKVDFRGELFEGSKRIIELSDKIEESTSICWCGKKARQNARVVNGKVTKEGPTILIDDDENKVKYTPLCNYHYYKAELQNSEENSQKNK